MADVSPDRHRSIALLSPAVGTGNIGDCFIEQAIIRLLDPMRRTGFQPVREKPDGLESRPTAETVYRRFSIRQPLTRDEIDAINRTDCALVCGTNLYQSEWESALTPEVLERIEVPVIPFGVGGSAAECAETSVSPTTRRMIQALHARCAVGSVRDPHTAKVVARAGVRNAVLTGCPVLHWAGQDNLPAVRPFPPQRLVVTARNWLMHRDRDNIDHPVQIDLLGRVLSDFAQREWTFAVHEEFDRRLVDRLRIPPDRVLESRDTADYLRLYTDPHALVLALRLHAGMLALANGVPAVFVGHDTRTYSFCEMLGIGYVRLFAEDCGERCIGELERQWRGDVPAPVSANAAFQRLREAMAAFLAANGLPARPEAVLCPAGSQARWA